jgi:hypothetical protein
MESWHQMLAGLAGGRLAALKRHAYLLCGDEWPCGGHGLRSRVHRN